MTHHQTFAPLRSTDFGKKPWWAGFRSFQHQFVFYPIFDWPKKGHESLRTPGFGQAKVLSGKFTNLYKLSSVGWCLPLSFWMVGKTSEDSSYDWVYHVVICNAHEFYGSTESSQCDAGTAVQTRPLRFWHAGSEVWKLRRGVRTAC